MPHTVAAVSHPQQFQKIKPYVRAAQAVVDSHSDRGRATRRTLALARAATACLGLPAQPKPKNIPMPLDPIVKALLDQIGGGARSQNVGDAGGGCALGFAR